MIILPAMDLMGGRPVRLAQGRFDDATDYLLDPAEAVLAFETAGAEWAHLVDLDGARAGAPRQHGLLADIALASRSSSRSPAAFREEAHFTRMFDAGRRPGRDRQPGRSRIRTARARCSPASAANGCASRSTSSWSKARRWWRRPAGRRRRSSASGRRPHVPGGAPPARHRYRPRRHDGGTPISI
jgi:hypothetical protein